MTCPNCEASDAAMVRARQTVALVIDTLEMLLTLARAGCSVPISAVESAVVEFRTKRAAMMRDAVDEMKGGA